MVLFFSLLSLLALAASLGLVAMMARPGLRATAVRELGGYALPVAVTVATVSTLGSLYLSEVEGFVPCLLCWVQRGFMYPLVLLLAWAIAGHSMARHLTVTDRQLVQFLARVTDRSNRVVQMVVLVMSIGGALTAAYHYGEQQGWWGGSEEFCSAEAPCTFIWVQHFGFMSIPFMAFTGFCLIALLVALHMNRPARTTR